MTPYFHPYFSRKAILAYSIGLLGVTVVFSKLAMPWYWILLGIVTVCLFFSLSSRWSQRWNMRPKSFERRLFLVTVLVRLLWIVIYYGITTSLWDTPWEQPIGTSMDSGGYYDEALWIIELLHSNSLQQYITYIQNGSVSDAGYPVFLSLICLLTNNSIFCTRIPNAFFDAWTVVLIYRLARRSFGEPTARMAALFTLLMPTSFFFAGTTMKESIMVMLVTWAIERSDMLLRQTRFSVKMLLEALLLIGLLAFFRTVLMWVCGLSLLCGVLLTSKRIIGRGRKFFIGLVVVASAVLVAGGVIIQQYEELMESNQMSENNFEYRANRKGGNALAANLGKAVFAPIIFAVPFPTMVGIEYQQVQQIQNGGNYVKNVMSFFCIMALILLLVSKEWKTSVTPIAFLMGYLVVLAFSSFAQSARFHMPAIPFEMMFAAYGVAHFTKPKYQVYFDWFMLFEFVVIIGWNWFKLKGRGMI